MSLQSSSVPLALSLLLSFHGLRRKSLSPNGAITAFIVGYAIMSSPVRAFGVGLITFYLVGSRATKYGKKRKTQLEQEYHEAGYRSGWQVLCNSLSALVAVTLWNAYFVPGSIHGLLVKGIGFKVPTSGPIYGAGAWCPTERTIGSGLSRFLFFAVLGQFSCCLGDTLASELGILSQTPPRMITTFKRVPPGTNGAISVVGTVASIAGGMIVGTAMGVSAVMENEKCDGRDLMEGIVWGGMAGGIGSVIDSWMGAIVQETLYDEKQKRVAQRKASGVVGIGGWNLLSNNQVNLLSSSLTALLIGWVTSRS
ncbi:hypothetical protein M378DRAFT_956113 [Amanita muscaria Koide BX008]|uniref:Integral membrane family protein n=1 Tax=Amanita muscaria (strain Koide BX008) TaxID=946122 RepID=A0A0C2T0U5_AMAMK|nr:hypothetical protein M378DRAFT_956113 [Amanita muscaria Koide BX008]